EEYANGAELDEDCVPPAYKFRRKQDGSGYRAWTPTPSRVIPMKRPPGMLVTPVAPRRKVAPTDPSEQYYDYSPIERVYRRDFFDAGKGEWEKEVRPQYKVG